MADRAVSEPSRPSAASTLIKDEVHAEYARIAARAAAAGRALNPMPTLAVGTRNDHDSRSYVGPPGSTVQPIVYLGRDMLRTGPKDRA